MHVDNLLQPLDDVAYLIECAALDCKGELKTELAQRCAPATTARSIALCIKRSNAHAVPVRVSLP